MKTNKILYILLAVLLCLPLTASAQKKKSHKKKGQKTEQKEETPKKTPYEKLLTDHKCESVRGNFLTLHKTDGKLYMEMPVSLLGKDLQIAATLSSTTNPNLGTVGLKTNNPYPIHFVKRDSTVVLQLMNGGFHGIDLSESEKASREINYINIAAASFRIAAYNSDSSAVVFDVSPLFLKDNKLFPVIAKQMGGYSVASVPQDNLTQITKMKVFDNNASVSVERSFQISLNGRDGRTLRSNYPVSITTTYSLLYLPEEPMTPRIADTRIGVFQTPALWMDPESKKIETVSYANRWRIEPADPEAYKEGKLTEPKKHIVYYLDNTFPELWKEPLRKGIVRWNRAFEKIGFKNVIEVRDFPTDDPNFDPDDLKYSCVRYIPTSEENAMGPSWVDLRTGEILNASVAVYANVAKVIQNWRFIQTAQLDEEVRQKELPYPQFADALSYVVAHEIGHTLGFMHNMAASSSYPTDSLRSASFMKEHGTTPSIMDYARFNYVAQPEDKGVSLTPPYLGVYDYFLIDWNYRYFPEIAGNCIEQSQLLKAEIEKRAHNPEYRYVLQQFGDKRIDPSAVEEDLGGDPQKSSEYGMKNLKYILAHLDEWIKDDPDARRKKELYDEIAMQAYMFADHVAMNIGGVYTTHTSESSKLPRYKVVNKQRQIDSEKWLLSLARTFGDMSNSKLDSQFDQPVKMFETLAPFIQKMAVGRIQKVSLSHYLDSLSYSPMEYIEDVYNNVFEKTIAGDENLTPAEMSLQKVFVKYLKPAVAAAGTTGGAIFLQNGKETPDVNFNLNDGCRCCRIQNPQSADELLQRNTRHIGFGKGYGETTDLWMQSVDRSLSYMFLYSKKTKELLTNSIKSCKNQDLKLHYLYLLKELNTKK